MSQQQQSALASFFNSIVGDMNTVSSLMPRLKNIDYDAVNNVTSFYGHTNFQEVKVNNKAVALAEQIPDISGKANVNHTHDIDDVVLTYEEEEETVNEEEETVMTTITKTKTLSDVLDGKADVIHSHTTDDITRDITTINEEEEEVIETVALNDILDGKAPYIHTHTTADLANWALATENFARLDRDNTFTGTHTITTTENSDYTDPFFLLAPNISSNHGVLLKLGRTNDKGNSGYIEYHWSGNNNVNNYIGIGHYSYDRLYKFYRDRVDFTQPLHITKSVSGNLQSLLTLNASMGNGNYNALIIGKSRDTNKSGVVRYIYNSTPSLQIGFYNNDGIMEIFSNNTTALKGTLTATGDITAPNITTITDTLANKADVVHTHKTDDITRDITTTIINEEEEEEEITETVALNDILDNKASINHNHDTEYATINHNHDTDYAAINHNHDTDYSSINHNHDADYAAINHTHDYSSTYAGINHNHDTDYAAINHTHDYSSTYAPINHNHDTDYAAINHNHDTDYAAINHNHDSTYATINHNHMITDITNLQTTLDSKASSSHNHSSSQLTDLEGLKEEIFKMIYPIGSIYITMESMSIYVTAGTEIDPETGIEYPAADEREIQWNGCLWELLNEGTFLMNVNVNYDPNTNPYLWTLSQAGQTGGEATHKHEFKFKYTLYHDNIGGCMHNGNDNNGNYGGIATYDYDSNNWVIGRQNGMSPSNVTMTHDGDVTSSWSIENTGATSTKSNMPPYITVYMYKRIA